MHPQAATTFIALSRKKWLKNLIQVFRVNSFSVIGIVNMNQILFLRNVDTNITPFNVIKTMN